MNAPGAVEGLLLELDTVAWRLDRDEDTVTAPIEELAHRAVRLADDADNEQRERLAAAVQRVALALAARRGRISDTLDRLPAGRRALRRYQTPEPDAVSDRDARWVRRLTHGSTS